MNFRLANIDDLPKLKAVYGNIINNMMKNNISIWDEIYPCEFFRDDIENNRLYLLEGKHDDIVAAFALCESSDGESHVKWKDPNDRALYLDRFGVNVNYSRKGIGSMMLKHAITVTKQKNIRYLRLFVVDINKPAINLYLKNGFSKVDGIYEERIDDDIILREYGFEIDALK
ncbi:MULTISPECIES: GNAT family N-acetyltransferase [Clostridium]|uniref:GNAT family N-acetyltransferase n=1 Tax=Clostridium TaxID=1485 RepID=UPI0008258F14|nr:MULTISPECIES: GNAT family N-acetyltransferase [Clostridium]PJI06726.1 N-acetyltransferase [Clostridium sp. CT7]